MNSVKATTKHKKKEPPLREKFIYKFINYCEFDGLVNTLKWFKEHCKDFPEEEWYDVIIANPPCQAKEHLYSNHTVGVSCAHQDNDRSVIQAYGFNAKS